jgi:subtilisin family serine protease
VVNPTSLGRAGIQLRNSRRLVTLAVAPNIAASPALNRGPHDFDWGKDAHRRTETFDAIAAATDEKSARGKEAGGDGSTHGTEVAGIIASHAALTGAAPQARLLGIRAFGKSGGRVAMLGTTYEILVS